MAKTACEEAADEFAELDRAGILELLPDEKGVSNTLIKRLRAEGRELKRLRKLVVELAEYRRKNFLDAAARIRKARKKK